MAEQLETDSAQIASRSATAGVRPRISPRSQPPRVIVTPVDVSLHHPLSRRDVQLVLSVLPPQSIEGLRSVSLLGPRARPDGSAVFASYRHAGFLRLHAAPVSPWLMPSLPPRTAVEFRQYGALIEMLSDGGSRVVWPGDSLRVYYTLAVLLPGVSWHRRERDSGDERDGDVRWLGSRAEPAWIPAVTLRQWSDLLRGRGPA